jgi:hypothetical protein
MLILIASLFDVYRAYAASEGVLTTGVILSKTDEVPNKAVVRIYKFQLAFRTRQNHSVVAVTEVNSDNYSSRNLRDSVQLRYEEHNPANVVLASGGWFPWRILGIAPLGIILIVVSITLGKQRRI